MIHHLPPDKQIPDPVIIICTGDLVLDVPEPDYWLDGIIPAIQEADIAIGHLEVPHTNSNWEMKGDVPAPGADPAHLVALQTAGFSVVTLAGNHIADCGSQGIRDTIDELENLGIAHTGAGDDLESARRPALVSVGDRCLAVLSYNCVGPQSAWAGKDSSGCAYLPVATSDGSPVAPPLTLTSPLPEAGQILEQDIATARKQADMVIVALHKGTVHTPAIVEEYERELARLAVEAGADIVIGHHAHIIRGIEFIQGKPVFHGLGNGCVVTHALSPGQEHKARAQWARKRKTLFGFTPDPAYELAPFHPEAVNAFLARFAWYADGHIEAGIVPVFVDPPGKPRLADSGETEGICNYLKDITARADLGILKFSESSDMVHVS